MHWIVFLLLEYVNELMDLLFQHVIYDQATYQQKLDEIQVPPNLCAEFERPAKDQAVKQHISRFKYIGLGQIVICSNLVC